MALAMIEGAERRGTLRPGMRVIEYTGGSTGSSLALVCSVKGYPFIALSSDAWSEEKLRTMRAFGAEVRVVSERGRQGHAGAHPDVESRGRAAGRGAGTFYANQFNNRDAHRRLPRHRHGVARASRTDLRLLRRRRNGRHDLRRLAGVEPAGTRIVALEPAPRPSSPPDTADRTASKAWASASSAAPDSRRLRRSARDRRSRGPRDGATARARGRDFRRRVDGLERRRRVATRARARTGPHRRDGGGRHGAQVPRRRSVRRVASSLRILPSVSRLGLEKHLHRTFRYEIESQNERPKVPRRTCAPSPTTIPRIPSG